MLRLGYMLKKLGPPGFGHGAAPFNEHCDLKKTAVAEICYLYSFTLSPTLTPFFSNHPWLTSSAHIAGAGDE